MRLHNGQLSIWTTIIEDDPVPVELSNFSVSINRNNVELTWETSSETNNHGFIIERRRVNSNSDSKWMEIGFVQGKGTSTEINKYRFVDSPTLNGVYNYRLKQVDFNGSFEYSKEVEVSVMVIEDFALMQNYPNPFNPSTVIKYQVAEGSHTTLKVYDVLGREVITLVNEEQTAGEYEVEFLISKDLSLSSGFYFYQLRAGNFIQTRKMIYLK
jgi:hypothetical protein